MRFIETFQAGPFADTVVSLLAAFMLALPVVLYQVWAFVAPGLYAHEKKLVLPLVVSSTLFQNWVSSSFFLSAGSYSIPVHRHILYSLRCRIS